MRLRKSCSTAAAALLGAAGLVLVTPPAAHAAGCTGTRGVTVVVDPNELGGGISAGCDDNGDGGLAADNFTDAGYTMEYSRGTGMAGYVCKLNGRPADGDCESTTAYWSLWWSDGTSGNWVYSSRGVGGLRVPEGGYVAFAWHAGAGRAVPPDVQATPRGATPSAAPSAAKPSEAEPGKKKPEKSEKSEKSGPGKPKTPRAPQPTPSAPSAAPTPSGSPSATETGAASPTSTAPTSATAQSDAPPASPSASGSSELPEIDDITAGPPQAEDEPTEDGGFPIWAGIGLAVLVLGAAGAVPILRRRQG